MKSKSRRFQKKLFDDAVLYGANNTGFLDKVCAFLIAISPILQHYKGMYVNAGFSVLLLISPYLAMKLFLKLIDKHYDSKCVVAIIPLLLFQLYKMLDHTVNMSKMFYAVFIIIIFIAIALGCVNAKYFLKCTTTVTVSAGICLIMQYFFYYIFHFHLKLVPTSLYRPSAFFLEPSHLFLYSFPVLCLLLLSPGINKKRKRCAVLVSAGMILSTSGMAVATTIGIWIVYYAFYNSKNNQDNIARLKNMFSAKNLLILFLILVVLIIAFFQVEVFRNMVLRIFSTGNPKSSTAIEGRTRLARMLVDGMSGKTLLFGVTENVDGIDFNLSGFYATLYKYGVIGIVLSYLFYILGVLKLKGAGFWISLIIVIISFFTAHTHGTFYMMYLVIVIMNCYHMCDIYKEK